MNSIEYILNGFTLAIVLIVLTGLIGFIVGLIYTLFS